MSDGGGGFLLIVLIGLYFLPALVAAMRGHHNTGAITLLNLFLGWTFLGWVIALVWSATAKRMPSGAPSTHRPERRGPALSDEQRAELRHIVASPITWLIALGIAMAVGITALLSNGGGGAERNYTPTGRSPEAIARRAAREVCRTALADTADWAAMAEERWAAEPNRLSIDGAEVSCTPFANLDGGRAARVSVIRIIASLEPDEGDPSWLRVELDDGTILGDPVNGPNERAIEAFGARLEAVAAAREAEEAARERDRLARERANRGRQWRSYTWRSEIDDFQNQRLTVDALTPVRDRFGRAQDVSLIIRCVENTTALIVSAGEYLGIGEVSVQMRIGDAPAVTRRLNISTDYRNFGLWNGGQSIPVIRQIMAADADRLVVRYTPYGENSRTVTFDVSGLDARIGPLRQACHW
ncbi:MAG: superinfection immunity protein [Alphaproteobacteria bacterium]|nr:superinfection immunity protein [Alphaproteobacteria bacterium]